MRGPCEGKGWGVIDGGIPWGGIWFPEREQGKVVIEVDVLVKEQARHDSRPSHTSIFLGLEIIHDLILLVIPWLKFPDDEFLCITSEVSGDEPFHSSFYGSVNDISLVSGAGV